MYYTGTDHAKVAVELGRVLADSNLITAIIQRWESTDEYDAMIDGENYYNVKHDITKKDFTTVNVYNDKTESWTTITNKNANTGINVNPFLRYLNRQKANYIAGKKIQFTVMDSETNPKAKALEDSINKELNDYFESTAYDLVLHASNKGREYLLPFITENGTFDYRLANAQNVILDIDNATGKLLSFMRYYNEDYLSESPTEDTEQTITQIRKVEIWDDKTVRFYRQTQPGGTYVFEDERPHFTYQKIINNKVDSVSSATWGRPPIVILNNNSEWQSDLLPIRTLIDAYDAVSTGYFQDVDTIQSVLYHINDFGGTDPTVIPTMIKLHRVLNTTGPDGKFEPIQIDIPYDAKEKILDKLEKNIFRFGEGVNMTKVSEMAGSLPIVAIETIHSDLYLKANNTISQLKLALKDFIWFLIYYMENKKSPGNVNPANVQKLADTVSAVIKVSKINNDTELTNRVISEVGAGLLSKKGAMNLLPDIQDVEKNLAEIEEEQNVDMNKVDVVPPTLTDTNQQTGV